jgi:hypothetical protein
VKLENVFRRVHTDSVNLIHGRSPLSEIYSDLILAPFNAVGGRPHQQYRTAGDVGGPTIAVVFEFGSGSGKTERGPLIVPGERQT